MKVIQLFLFVLIIGTVQNAAANSCSANNQYAKKPDGCSSWSNNPKQFRDKWGTVNFRPACMTHDRCYYTLSSTEASCNNAFAKNLLKACKDGLSLCRKIGGRKICTPPEPASFTACSAFAGGMVGLVRAASRSVYRKAQKKQREHENKCASQVQCKRTVKIFTIIDGKKCGLEWAGGKGKPAGENERLAKFDCGGSADTMCISESGETSFISSRAEGERCSLEYSAAKGSFSGINNNESLAKFDCDTKGDPLFISGNRIYTLIDGKKCYLESSAAFGGARVGEKEKAAKFDCGSKGDLLIIQ